MLYPDYGDANSIGEVFLRSVEQFGDNDFLKYRDKDETKTTLRYNEVYDIVNCFSRGLSEIGIARDNISLFAENRVEWFIADMAIIGLGGVSIPRGADASVYELEYIANHSDSTVIIVENQSFLEKIDGFRKKYKLTIVLDSSLHDIEDNIYSYDYILKLGRDKISENEDFFKDNVKNVKKDDIFSIVYTSGTTGHPKGVIITHSNILHQIISLPQLAVLQTSDSLVSMLPIWHTYERMITYVIMSLGIKSMYSNRRKIRNDLAKESPTVFISVPALWVKIYNSVMSKVRAKNPIVSCFILKIIDNSIIWTRYKAIKNKQIPLIGDENYSDILNQNKAGISHAVSHFLAKTLVYNKIIKTTGGRLRFSISGGSALPEYIEDFMMAVGIPIRVGWGITETSPVISLRPLYKNLKLTSGMVVDRCEVQIRDNDGNILPDGKEGVCWIKGDNVMRGYYKDEANTNKVLIDGWFNSGDLGLFTNEKQIIIKGRAKDTIVLLSGKNIEPDGIENKILESRYISEMITVGQDRKYLTALVVIDIESIMKYFLDNNIKIDEQNIYNSNEAYQLIKSEIKRLNSSENNFKPYERVKDFLIIEEEFTVDNGLLTQTLKKKRNVILKKYEELINSIYDK